MTTSGSPRRTSVAVAVATASDSIGDSTITTVPPVTPKNGFSRPNVRGSPGPTIDSRPSRLRR